LEVWATIPCQLRVDKQQKRKGGNEMEIVAIMKLIPQILAVVEVVKRFIPDRRRAVANPAIAAVTGLLGAWYAGGSSEVFELVTTGLVAAAGAIGTYKIPKEIGKKMNI